MIFYKVVDYEDDQYYKLSDPKFNINKYSEYLAEEIAQDFFENHDGWESSWPLTFALYNEDGGKEICRHKVELSHEPVFSAERLYK